MTKAKKEQQRLINENKRAAKQTVTMEWWNGMMEWKHGMG
jgi:hypothetical protein